MTKGDVAFYGFVAFMIFAVGFFGYVAVAMIRQFLATGSMMRGPKSNGGGDEREDPPGHRSYTHDDGVGHHD